MHFLGLELLKEAIAKAGYTDKVDIGMDVAASGKFCVKYSCILLYFDFKQLPWKVLNIKV